MQNKGAIRLFAILLAIVSFYQLIFTYITYSVENDARDYAISVSKGDPALMQLKETHYLDSIEGKEVFNLFFLQKYTYKECKEKEINFGLDLKGGMNLILEVKVSDIVKALSNYNTDETFKKALRQAEIKEKSSTEDFITLFGREFESIDANAKLAAIFSTVELKGKIDYTKTNKEVLAVIRTESNSAIDNAFNILRTRIDRFGVTQPNIQKLEKAGRVLVELPGIKDPARVRKLLQGTASLEFWETYNLSEIFESIKQADAISQQTVAAANTPVAPVETDKADDVALLSEVKQDSTEINASKSNVQSLFTFLTPSQNGENPAVGVALSKDTASVNAILQSDAVKNVLPADLKLFWTIKSLPAKETKYYTNKVLGPDEELFQLVAIKQSSHDGRPPLEGDVITGARADTRQGGDFEVSMSMNSEGAKTWARLTKANIKKSIAIVLDGYVYSFPTVQDEITGGRSSITGNFSVEEAQDLANILKSGKLPAPARIVEDTVVGPSLGKEAVDSGMTSFILAFIFILAYMVFFYGFRAGWVADLAMVFNLFAIFGVMASFGAVLTLPGIAGIVLTIGMAVDANVLIYERIREEIASGKATRLAISDGYKNAYSAIIDGNVTTFLTGVILYMFGTGPIQGFATTLMIGIATSMFSAIFITRIIYERLAERKVGLKFDTKFTRNFLQNVKIDWLGKRNLFFIISAIIILPGLISLGVRGLKQGIDFTGGRTFVVRFDNTVSSTQIQSALVKTFDGATVEVKTFGSDNQVRIATNYMNDAEGEHVTTVIENKLYDGLKPFISDKTVSLDKFLSDYRMSSQVVGPTIASDIKAKAGYAIIFSLIGIFLYIFVRFRNWEFGMGGLVSLAHDVAIVFGIYSMFYSIAPFSLEIDQTFIAAILTVVGYSINDTVIVYDRIREYNNIHPKRSLIDNMNDAINATLSRTFNTSFTTLVVLLVIFMFGGEVIRGFIFAMLIGIGVGTYSSIFIATPITYILVMRKKKKIAVKA